MSRHHVCFHFRGTGEVFIIQREEKGGVEGMGGGRRKGMKVYFRRIGGNLGGEDWGTNAIKQKKILINTLYYF